MAGLTIKKKLVDFVVPPASKFFEDNDGEKIAEIFKGVDLATLGKIKLSGNSYSIGAC